MLQTIRDFATERLQASGEADDIAGRHSAIYAALATRVGAGIESEEQLAWMERGIADEPNLQAAFENRAAAERAMTSFGDLWMYWHIRGKHHARSLTTTDGELESAPVAPDLAMEVERSVRLPLGPLDCHTTTPARRSRATRKRSTPWRG